MALCSAFWVASDALDLSSEFSFWAASRALLVASGVLFGRGSGSGSYFRRRRGGCDWHNELLRNKHTRLSEQPLDLSARVSKKTPIAN